MARDPANAGQLRERVQFLRQGVDQDGVPDGTWHVHLEAFARIESQPSPSRVAAERLEGMSAILVTIRANARTLQIGSALRMTWELTGRTYQLAEGELDERRAWISFLAHSPAGGFGQ